ncbi:MAG: hypothetical protein ACTHNN_09950 [Xanthobacteraceae bacterium]
MQATSILGIARPDRQINAMAIGISIDVAIESLPHRQHCRQRKKLVVQQCGVRESIGIKHPAQAEAGGSLRQVEFAQRSRINDSGAAGQPITRGGLHAAAQQKSGESPSSITQDISRRLHRAAPSMTTPEGKSKGFPVLTTLEPALYK